MANIKLNSLSFKHAKTILSDYKIDFQSVYTDS